MKNFTTVVLLSFVFILSSFQLRAQESEQTAPVFISLSTGINHTGLIGLGLEVPVIDKLAIFADAGLGGWGSKIGVGVSYYFNTVRKGSGINLGYYTASGTRGNSVEITQDNNDTVDLLFERVGTINVSYSLNLKMGKKGKFAFVAGYAIAAGDKDSSYISSDDLDDLGNTIVNILHPDGVILGVKFMFGVGG